MSLRPLVAACAAAALLAGCNGGDDPPPERFDRGDAERISVARERLDDAIDTTEAIRTSRAEARRLVRLVRQAQAVDDRRQAEVPSLGSSLDDAATREFLRYARSQPRQALHGAASREVDAVVRALDDAEGDTRIATLENVLATRFLEATARDIRDIWPDLARKLDQARADLG